MNNKEYNGWTNYETWVTKLWMDNDHGTYCFLRVLAQDCWDNAKTDTYAPTKERQAVYDLADALKEWMEENNPLANKANVYTDLLNAAIQEVNWHEIAESWLEDIGIELNCTKENNEQ